jgi:alkylation response protein AidB-like acyl-CoA dehydrogenase
VRLRADLAYTPELRAFRDELAAWLAERLTPEFAGPELEDPTGASGEAFERRRAWQRELYDGGWVGVHWPKDHGGRGAGLVEYALYLLTCAEAGAPDPVNTIGLSMVGPTLIDHGSPQQLALLPGILSAEAIWAQLFSEPEAGSDLGAIRTRAQATSGGGWVVNGQKVWTTWGPVADMGFLLARTGGSGFAGLSCFVIDMHAPGVTVRGLRQMGGETHFSEVFLDDVELPADALVGEEGQGWSVATGTLAHERTTAILSRHASTLRAATALLQLAGRPGASPSERDRALAAWSEAQLLCLSGYRAVVAAAEGRPSPAVWIQRLQWGLVNRRLFEVAAALRGPEAMLAGNAWDDLLLTSRGWTIGGGTSEIQRNMLAEKILGLPREPKPGKP